jgi:uncharacterized protein (DUF885 family)
VKSDADAYLARLEAFAVAMDQEDEVVRHDVALGTVPPDFALAKTLGQMTKFRAIAPDQSVLVTSVATPRQGQEHSGRLCGAGDQDRRGESLSRARPADRARQGDAGPCDT